MAAKKAATGSVSVSKDLTFKYFCEKLQNGLYENLRGAKIASGKAKWAPDDKTKANALVDQYFGRTPAKAAPKATPAPKKAPVAKAVVEEEEEEEEAEEPPPAAVKKVAPKKATMVAAGPAVSMKGKLEPKSEDKTYGEFHTNRLPKAAPTLYPASMSVSDLLSDLNLCSIQLRATDDAQLRSILLGTIEYIDRRLGSIMGRARASEGFSGELSSPTVALAVPADVSFPKPVASEDEETAPEPEETLPLSVLGEGEEEADEEESLVLPLLKLGVYRSPILSVEGVGLSSILTSPCTLLGMTQPLVPLRVSRSTKSSSAWRRTARKPKQGTLDKVFFSTCLYPVSGSFKISVWCFCLVEGHRIANDSPGISLPSSRPRIRVSACSTSLS